MRSARRYVSNTQTSSPANCTACARKRAAIVDADRIDGIETIGRLEIDRGRIVLLKLAAKAGGYILILKGHPPATTEEVLLSFHRSFK